MFNSLVNSEWACGGMANTANSKFAGAILGGSSPSMPTKKFLKSQLTSEKEVLR
jgi:hypothetical protein